MDEVAPPPRVPARVYVDPEHMVKSVPAFTVGMAFIVRIITSLIALHGPEGLFVVSVNDTAPVVISAADGV